MAGKGDGPRDYNRAEIKPHSKEWDTNYEATFGKENLILKTYEIVEASNVKKARQNDSHS